MLCEDRDEAIAVRGLDEMDHLMDDDVLEKVFGLFHKFRIEPDMSCLMITAAPLRFHSLQEIAGHFHL